MNVQFTALLSVAPPFEPGSEFAADPREKALMQTLSPGPNVSKNDLLQEIGTVNTWQVLWRDANPADFTLNFILARVVEGTDS